MFRRTAIALIAALLAFSSAHAQTTWESRIHAGELAFAQGDQERAEKEFRAAVKLAQSFRAGDPQVETSYENLARLLAHQSRLDESQPVYELLLAATELRIGESHPDLLGTLAALGRVALGAGDVPTAETSLRRYVTIADAATDPDPSPLRAVLALLARMATLAERHDEAVELQRRVAGLALHDPMLVPGEKAHYVETLVQAELTHGNPELVLALIEQAATLRSQDEDPVMPATTWARAAAAAASAAEPSIAEAAAERALQLEGDLKATRMALQALADASWLQVPGSQATVAELIGVASDSELLQQADQRTTAVMEWDKSQATDNAAYAIENARRIFLIKVLRGQFSQAAQLQKERVANLKPVGGKALTKALEDLFALQHASGKVEDALATNAEITALLETQHGTVHASLVPVLERQLTMLTDLKQKKEARAVKKRLKKLRKSLR
ncbi:MAG: tetratricopeptide repeat protein [bacterium]|nr:tetratricopeptide repeat protein [bacterium]